MLSHTSMTSALFMMCDRLVFGYDLVEIPGSYPTHLNFPSRIRRLIQAYRQNFALDWGIQAYSEESEATRATWRSHELSSQPHRHHIAQN